MKNVLFVLLFLFILLPAAAVAQWHDKDGRPVADTESMKSSDDFGASLLLIGDEEEFLKKWATPSKVFPANNISKIEKGGIFITPIIFAGCYANSDGNCVVTADIRVFRPDGTTYGEQRNVEVWKDKPPPPKGILGLSVGYLKILVEPQDPEGTYRVQATVTDVVKKASLVLSQKITVSGGAAQTRSNQTGNDAIKEIDSQSGSLKMPSLISHAGPPKYDSLQINQIAEGYELQVPVSKLILIIPKNGLVQKEMKIGGGTNSPRYFYFENPENDADKIILSGWFEPAQKFIGVKQDWENKVNAWGRKGMLPPKDVSFTRINNWDAVFYDDNVPNYTYAHLSAHLVQAGTWIDVHISLATSSSSQSARARLAEILKSIQVKEIII
jgi:hypothetical protein